MTLTLEPTAASGRLPLRPVPQQPPSVPPTELARWIERHTRVDGRHPSPLESLELFRASVPSEPVYSVYRPSLCVIAQGSKTVLLANETHRYDQDHFLLVSVDLPVSGQVVQASAQAPYLALRMDLDLVLAAELMAEMDSAATGIRRFATPRGIMVTPLERPLQEALVRLLELLETPQHVRTLVPLIQREIHYRLLCGEQGEQFRRMVMASGQISRVAEAIEWIRSHYDQPLRIESLAREVSMSPSGLHHHFKAVTAMSPLQFQKQLRLQEARRLMLVEDLDAASVSFRVGYESPSQFSREYRRQFGEPPRRDVERLRAHVGQAWA